MHPDLQRYLDGEIAREALTPEQQREADAFESWSRAVTRDRAPAWLENRILVSLPVSPGAPWYRQVLSYLIEPKRVRIRPLSMGLAAAILAALLVVPQQTLPPAAESAATPVVQPVSSSAVVYVQFVFVANGARSVAVAGDFNDWQREGVALRDADGDGVWTGFVALRPGQHKYMFIVDGEQWVTDPGAERYVDDGFGMQNAVITVTAPARSS